MDPKRMVLVFPFGRKAIVPAIPAQYPKSSKRSDPSEHIGFSATTNPYPAVIFKKSEIWPNVFAACDVSERPPHNRKSRTICWFTTLISQDFRQTFR